MNDVAKRPGTVHGLAFSDEQRRMIRDTYANGATDEEFAVLMEIARARNLNPILRQIHFVKRWDSKKRRDVWQAQVAIDGMRAIAHRTGLYAGADPTEFEYGQGPRPIKATTRVYRKDIERPFVGVAFWDEAAQYAGGDGERRLTNFWAQMPHRMLGVASERDALRRAFPEETLDLSDDDEDVEAATETAKSLAAPAAVKALPPPTPTAAETVGATAKPAAQPAARKPAQKAPAAQAAPAPLPPAASTDPEFRDGFIPISPPPSPLAPTQPAPVAQPKPPETEAPVRAPAAAMPKQPSLPMGPVTPAAPGEDPWALAPPGAQVDMPEDMPLPWQRGPYGGKKLSDLVSVDDFAKLVNGFATAASTATDDTSKAEKLAWVARLRAWAQYRGVPVVG